MSVPVSAQAAKEMAVIAEAAHLDSENAAAAATGSAFTATGTPRRCSTIVGSGNRLRRGDSLATIRFARQTKGSGAATRGLRKAEESQAVTSASMLQQAATATCSVTAKPATTQATTCSSTNVAVAGRSHFAAAFVASRSTRKRALQAQTTTQAQTAVMSMQSIAALVTLFTVTIPQARTEFGITVKGAPQAPQERPARAAAVAAG